MTPMVIFTRLLGMADQFSMISDVRSLLGTVTRDFDQVRILVDLRPIDSTSPSTFLNCTQSPTLKGLSVNITIVPKKFAIVSCAARATANPPIPSPARRELTEYPRFWMIRTAPNTTTRILNAWRARGAKCSARSSSALPKTSLRISERKSPSL